MKTKIILITCLTILSINNLNAQIFERVKNSEFNSVTLPTDGGGWIDYDGDGDIDIYLTNFFNNGCILFENKGDGNFAFKNNGSIIPTNGNFSGISWGDYDNDGKADMFLANLSGVHALYKNMGKGQFVAVKNSSVTTNSLISLQSNWIDYDNDGWLDLFIPAAPNLGFSKGSGVKSILYHNNGDGNFTQISGSPVTEDLGSHSCAAFADMDNDGDQDLFIPEWQNDNFLYENNGDGTFKKISGTAVNSNSSTSISCSWGDYDNDGFMDLFVGNGSTSSTEKQNNYLFHNNGDKTFTKADAGELTSYKGCTWSETWADVDNDGDLDILLANIYEPGQLFLNNGDGTFKNADEFTSDFNSTAGASFGDYDKDGFLDFAIAYANNTDMSQVLFHNKGNNNHWVSVTCTGSISNKSAIGTRVKVKAAIGGNSYWQIRDINGNQGHRNFNDLKAHFGLGDATKIDSLVIIWPTGRTTTQKDIDVDQFLTITEEIPAEYMRPDFEADTLVGKDSLKVNFKDISIVDPNTPVITWKWDFDNDGTIDSEEQNPTYQFFAKNKDASFTISLTASNGKDTIKVIKQNYINVKRKMPIDFKNIAKFRKAYSSTIETSGREAERAVDGSLTTRWSSQFSDPQWILIDLAKIDTIGGVIIRWEAAAAQEYKLLVSEDSINWTEVYHTEDCPGDVDEVVFDKIKARYVKMDGITRKTPYGYSMYEFEIYGYGEVLSDLNAKNFSKLQLTGMPNPFSNKVEIEYSLESTSDVELNIYNINGQRLNTLNFRQLSAGEHSYMWDGKNTAGSDAPNGIYFCKLLINNKITNYTETIRLIKSK